MFVTRNRFKIFAQDDPFVTTSTAENIPNIHQTNTDAETIIIKPLPNMIVKGVEDNMYTTMYDLN